MAGILTIAKWELLRTKLEKKNIVMIFLFLVAIAAITYSVLQTSVRTNSDIYTIAVSDSDIAQIVVKDDRFSVTLQDPNAVMELYIRGDADIAVINREVYAHDTEKSRAALGTLTNVLKSHREATLASYDDFSNSFPVWITLHYLHRTETFQLPAVSQPVPAKEEGIPEEPKQVPSKGEEIPEEPQHEKEEGLHVSPQMPPSDGGIHLGRFAKQTAVTPSNFKSPIPFTSAMIAFIFMFPLYFIAQFFSASVMNERTNRNGEFLLVSPLRTYEIVIGKMLPYLTMTLIISFFLALYLRHMLSGVMLYELVKDSLIIIAIMLPVVLMFLAFYFVASIVARSFKELTFVTVFFSTAVSSYLFFPVMFAHIHAISIISPMTLVVRILEDEVIQLSEYVFSAIPLYCISITIFALGTLIYREEDLFTQLHVKEKIMDAIELFLRGKLLCVFVLSMIFVPFAYAAELMLIVLLFAAPLRYSIIAMIVLTAVVEELFKSVGIYTLFHRGHAVSVKDAFLLAILAATGFFIGEKLIAFITIAAIASSVFGEVMSMGALPLLPLLLHIACTTIVSVGLSVRKNYVVLLFVAAALHGAYNLYLLRGVLYA